MGAGLLMAQSDAWVNGDQYAIMQPGAYTAVLLNAGRELRTEKLIVRP